MARYENEQDKATTGIELAKEGVILAVEDMFNYTESEAEHYAKTYDITPEVLIEYRNELIKKKINC